MDEITQRLQETSKNCLEAYQEWAAKKDDQAAQEKLHAVIHELRKVSSRLEIELAMSERKESVSKPIPIPSHKSNQKPDKGSVSSSSQSSAASSDKENGQQSSSASRSAGTRARRSSSGRAASSASSSSSQQSK